MSLKFKPEDFKIITGPGQGGPNVDVYMNLNPFSALLIAQQAQIIFDAWLAEQPQISCDYSEEFSAWIGESEHFAGGRKYTARLVDVKPVSAPEGKTP